MEGEEIFHALCRATRSGCMCENLLVLVWKGSGSKRQVFHTSKKVQDLPLTTPLCIKRIKNIKNILKPRKYRVAKKSLYNFKNSLHRQLIRYRNQIYFIVFSGC